MQTSQITLRAIPHASIPLDLIWWHKLASSFSYLLAAYNSLAPVAAHSSLENHGRKGKNKQTKKNLYAVLSRQEQEEINSLQISFLWYLSPLYVHGSLDKKRGQSWWVRA